MTYTEHGIPSIDHTQNMVYPPFIVSPQTPHVNITCIDTMLYICYYFIVIVIVIFYSQYAQVPWNFLYAFYVK